MAQSHTVGHWEAGIGDQVCNYLQYAIGPGRGGQERETGQDQEGTSWRDKRPGGGAIAKEGEGFLSSLDVGPNRGSCSPLRRL